MTSDEKYKITEEDIKEYDGEGMCEHLEECGHKLDSKVCGLIRGYNHPQCPVNIEVHVRLMKDEECVGEMESGHQAYMEAKKLLEEIMKEKNEKEKTHDLSEIKAMRARRKRNESEVDHEITEEDIKEYDGEGMCMNLEDCFYKMDSKVCGLIRGYNHPKCPVRIKIDVELMKDPEYVKKVQSSGKIMAETDELLKRIRERKAREGKKTE